MENVITNRVEVGGKKNVILTGTTRNEGVKNMVCAIRGERKHGGERERNHKNFNLSIQREQKSWNKGMKEKKKVTKGPHPFQSSVV